MIVPSMEDGGVIEGIDTDGGGLYATLKASLLRALMPSVATHQVRLTNLDPRCELS